MNAELYEQAIKYEKGSFITSSGAMATLSGAKTGRSPKDKRVVRDETTEDDLWWGKYVSLSRLFPPSNKKFERKIVQIMNYYYALQGITEHWNGWAHIYGEQRKSRRLFEFIGQGIKIILTPGDCDSIALQKI